MTRAAPEGVDRKAFLAAFADQLLASLFALPPRKWGDVLGAADAFGQGHLLGAWFSDAADQALVARSGFDGAVRQDPGDYLYPVDANVAPATKLNLLTTRTLELEVQIDDVGNARNTLDVTWDNKVEAPEREPVPRDGQHGRAHPRDVLPAPRPRAEPRRGGLRGNPLAGDQPGRRRGRGRPDRDRHLPQGSAGRDEPPVHVDESVRRRRDQRDLPAHDPGPARHAARSAHAHDPGAGWYPDHGSQPGARRDRVNGDARHDVRPGPRCRRAVRTVTGDWAR